MAYGLRRCNDQVIEICDQCGFDTRLVSNLSAAMAAGFDAITELQLRPQATQRPDQDVWSAVEYAEHVVSSSERVVALVHAALGRPAPAPASQVASAKEITIACLQSISLADGDIPCPFEGAPTTVGGLLLHLLHDIEHHVLDVRRGLAKLTIRRSQAIYPAETHWS
ncbi:MAG TPA: DinB family protein [Rugosimonospora sp.]|nr:DinB family protein [Rugosimonospora sp.]